MFRADAAFAKPEIFEVLEKGGVKYVIRISSNDRQERDIAELLTQPVGRPSRKSISRQISPNSTSQSDMRRGHAWELGASIGARGVSLLDCVSREKGTDCDCRFEFIAFRSFLR